jgi:hypothetical protein
MMLLTITDNHGNCSVRQSCSVSFPANMSDLDPTNGVKRVHRAAVICRS